MKWKKEKLIPVESITNGITEETIKFAEEFGTHLATKEEYNKSNRLIVAIGKNVKKIFSDNQKTCINVFVQNNKIWEKWDGEKKVILAKGSFNDFKNEIDTFSTDDKLTTSQLRRFFGEVKRQQSIGYQEANFVLLKPKLAYAVGRAKKDNNQYYNKIEDLFYVLSNAIDIVIQEERERENAVKEAKTDKGRDKAELERSKHLPFKSFISIFEAIIAYHKASIEKDN